MLVRSREKGFTVIELLIAVSIVGILSSIAVRQFISYRVSTFDARAEYDLRVAAAMEEEYFNQNDRYADCTDTNCEQAFGNFALSDGTRISLISREAGNAYLGIAFHPLGQKRYLFDSEEGVLRPAS